MASENKAFERWVSFNPMFFRDIYEEGVLVIKTNLRSLEFCPLFHIASRVSSVSLNFNIFLNEWTGMKMKNKNYKNEKFYFKMMNNQMLSNSYELRENQVVGQLDLFVLHNGVPLHFRSNCIVERHDIFVKEFITSTPHFVSFILKRHREQRNGTTSIWRR